MKVIVDSNLLIQHVFEPPVELGFDGGRVTLLDLLKKVDSLCMSVQLLADAEPGDDIRNIFVNGKNYFSLPKGLGTVLNDGDKVNLEIYMEPLGGG